MRNLWNAQNCFPECSRTRFRGQAKLSANAGKETYTATSVTIKIIAREDFNREAEIFSSEYLTKHISVWMRNISNTKFRDLSF